MHDFLKEFERISNYFPLHLRIYHSKMMDWCINIWKDGCAEDYPKSDSEGGNAIVVQVQECNMEYAFAKAHVKLHDWMMKNTGGC